MQKQKLNLKELAEYGKDFSTRRFALRDEAHRKVAEILSKLPNKELISENTLGWFLYENLGGEWVENAIHGMKYDELGRIIVTSDLDYDKDNKPCVDDWSDRDREMTFDELDDCVNINWPLTLEQMISELENNPKHFKKE